MRFELTSLQHSETKPPGYLDSQPVAYSYTGVPIFKIRFLVYSRHINISLEARSALGLRYPVDIISKALDVIHDGCGQKFGVPICTSHTETGTGHSILSLDNLKYSSQAILVSFSHRWDAHVPFSPCLLIPTSPPTTPLLPLLSSIYLLSYILLFLLIGMRKIFIPVSAICFARCNGEIKYQEI